MSHNCILGLLVQTEILDALLQVLVESSTARHKRKCWRIVFCINKERLYRTCDSRCLLMRRNRTYKPRIDVGCLHFCIEHSVFHSLYRQLQRRFDLHTVHARRERTHIMTLVEAHNVTCKIVERRIIGVSFAIFLEFCTTANLILGKSLEVAFLQCIVNVVVGNRELASGISETGKYVVFKHLSISSLDKHPLSP